MARWRVVVELSEEYPDAGHALQSALRQFGARVVRVVSRVSDEIGIEERQGRRRGRRPLFLDEEDAT
jgi:hypothetical protein